MKTFKAEEGKMFLLNGDTVCREIYAPDNFSVKSMQVITEEEGARIMEEQDRLLHPEED